MLLDGIGKRYRIGGPWVLRDVRLELRPGRVVRVQGQNGSGKSTLLRVIAGIAEPSSGRVSGRPSTGYVPERFPAALPFTADQYLRHHARMRGVAPSQGTELLARFGAEQFAGTAMKELSKGTSQKIAVTQALLGDPDLLVLDEAWTGLDTAARDEFSAVVRERARGGACVVFVDHDPARLSGGTDEWWVVRDGGLVALPGDTPQLSHLAHTDSATARSPAGAGPAAAALARTDLAGAALARTDLAGAGPAAAALAGADMAGADPAAAALAGADMAGAGPAAADHGAAGGPVGRVAATALVAVEVSGVPDVTSLRTLLPEAEVFPSHGGVQRIVVPEARSDEALRLLLALRPEVHIVAVSPAPTQIRATEES